MAIVKSKELKAALANATKETAKEFLEIYGSVTRNEVQECGPRVYADIKASKPIIKGLVDLAKEQGLYYGPWIGDKQTVKGGIKE